MNKLDLDYQNLLKDILENGVKKETRNGGTISVFGRQIRHKMSEGFPLLTTKKMPWKSIVTELLWFLQGNTNIEYLVDNNCHIWDGDAYQAYLKECEKLKKEEFLEKLKTDRDFNNRYGRKHITEGKMVLPPCHYGFQVYTRELSLDERIQWVIKNRDIELDNLIITEEAFSERTPTRAISLMWNQRSCDLFLGIPFNIASYGLLLEIIAKEVNMIPDELIGNLGDVHLYSNHIEQAKEQIGRELTHEERTELLKQTMGEEKYNKAVDELMSFGGGLSEYYDSYKIPYTTREPYKLPRLKFSPCPITGIDMEYQSIAQFQIENYESHPTIKYPLSN
jgi:thymidylate synthase